MEVVVFAYGGRDAQKRHDRSGQVIKTLRTLRDFKDFEKWLLGRDSSLIALQVHFPIRIGPFYLPWEKKEWKTVDEVRGLFLQPVMESTRR